MQRLIHTRDGSGCRAGLLVRAANGSCYLLTCGHPFHRDEPFATAAIGQTVDGYGRAVLYARLRSGTHVNAIDGALIATSESVPPRAALTLGAAKGALLLNGGNLTVTSIDAPVRLSSFGFEGMALADGPPCHRGQSGSLVTNERGDPVAIVIGMFDSRVVLCPLGKILRWFGEQGLGGLVPVALAIQGE